MHVAFIENRLGAFTQIYDRAKPFLSMYSRKTLGAKKNMRAP